MNEIPEDKLDEVAGKLLDWVEKDKRFLESLEKMVNEEPDTILEYFRKMLVLELRIRPDVCRQFVKDMIENIKKEEPEKKKQELPKFNSIEELQSYIDREANRKVEEIIKKRNKID